MLYFLAEETCQSPILLKAITSPTPSTSNGLFASPLPSHLRTPTHDQPVKTPSCSPIKPNLLQYVSPNTWFKRQSTDNVPSRKKDSESLDEYNFSDDESTTPATSFAAFKSLSGKTPSKSFSNGISRSVSFNVGKQSSTSCNESSKEHAPIKRSPSESSCNSETSIIFKGSDSSTTSLSSLSSSRNSLNKGSACHSPEKVKQSPSAGQGLFSFFSKSPSKSYLKTSTDVLSSKNYKELLKNEASSTCTSETTNPSSFSNILYNVFSNRFIGSGSSVSSPEKCYPTLDAEVLKTSSVVQDISTRLDDEQIKLIEATEKASTDWVMDEDKIDLEPEENRRSKGKSLSQSSDKIKSFEEVNPVVTSTPKESDRLITPKKKREPIQKDEDETSKLLLTPKARRPSAEDEFDSVCSSDMIQTTPSKLNIDDEIFDEEGDKATSPEIPREKNLLKSKRHFNLEQSEILQKFYETNHSPKKAEIAKLSQELHVDTKRVSWWFSCARKMDKSKSERSSETEEPGSFTTDKELGAGNKSLILQCS